jgi:predicted ATP-dependent endonuclease of OLD family
VQLYIKTIEIENFKSFNRICIRSHQSFNVIIGENNIGKSTIFEAVQLWYKCYQLLVTAKGDGFYKATGSNSYYLSYHEIDFLRLTNDSDMFHNRRVSSCKIIVTISDQIDDFRLGVEVIKPRSLKNSFFRVRYIEQSEFARYNQKLRSIPSKPLDAVFVYQTRPVSNILENEPYMNEGQIKRKIATGQSHEVLRNKIISRNNEKLRLLSEQISEITGTKAKFIEPTPRKKNEDEYIDLEIEMDDRKTNLYLQGSGFLQIAEILSTIEYIDAPLNILLVDEPDSHIHIKIQRLLLQYLRKITSNQIFLISHNDSFVSQAQEDEIFFLSKDRKAGGLLEHIQVEDVGILKNELGGVIIGLERLNEARKIFFVEGKGDENYMINIVKKLSEVFSHDVNVHNYIFLNLRGKDYLEKKIDNTIRILGQLFSPDKSLNIIHDRDFSTQQSNEDLSFRLGRKIGDSKNVFTHCGYCIESTLFSDHTILVAFLHDITEGAVETGTIEMFVQDYFRKVISNIGNVHSDIFQTLDTKFKGQKKDSRPELKNVDFSDFVREINESRVSFLMNKGMIKNFVIEFENQLSEKLVSAEDDTSVEFYAGNLFNSYIQSMTSPGLVNKAMRELYGFITAR